MRVLVVGGAGYTGAVLVPKLLNSGYRVRVLDQMIFGRHTLHSWLSHPQLELLTGSIEHEELVKKAVRDVDAVIHLAGLANDPSCDLAPELTEQINYQGTLRVATAAREAGVERFLFASSASVYGAAGDQWVDETSPLQPVSLYAKVKVRCENVLLAAPHNGLATCSLRKATIYGYSPRMRFDLVVNTLTGLAVFEKRIVINGGDQWRPHIHIADVADAYLRCLEASPDKIAGEVFNIGSENYQIKDIARMISTQIPHVDIALSGSEDQRSYRAKFDKFQNTLRFQPRKTIHDGIREVKEACEDGRITNFRDLNYYNVKRVLNLGL